MRARGLWLASAALAALAAGGCDPIVNIQGSFFPAWIVCLVAGVALTAVAHWLFVLVRLAPYLGPPLLIYPCLSLLLTLAIWLVFYRS